MERWRDTLLEMARKKREAESEREREGGRRWEVQQPCMQRGCLM